MDNLINGFKKVARLILIIGLFVAAGFTLVGYLVGLGGGFFPVVTQLLLMSILVAFYSITAVLLLLKKDKEAKLAFIVVVSYWFIDTMVGLISAGVGIYSDNQAMNVVVDIFELILGLTLLGVLVMVILTKLFGMNFMAIARIILLCSLVLFFLVFVFNMIDNIVDEDGFMAILQSLIFCYVVPAAMIAGLFYFFDGESASKE